MSEFVQRDEIREIKENSKPVYASYKKRTLQCQTLLTDLLEQKHEFFRLIFKAFVTHNQMLFANLHSQIASASQPPPQQQPLLDFENNDPNSQLDFHHQ